MNRPDGKKVLEQISRETGGRFAFRRGCYAGAGSIDCTSKKMGSRYFT